MRRSILLTGAAMAAIASSAFLPATAADNNEQESDEITAYFGHIDPFFGQIDPFFGQIDPFFGHINPFYADGNNNSFGDISPFWGTIEPFWGTINPFFGDISPFWGDISPFFGHIDPFYETNPEFYDKLYAHYGDLRPFWGDIAAFWGDIGPQFGDIDAFWGDIRPFEDYAGDWDQLATMLSDIDTRAEMVWGPAIEAKTGLSYREGFADALYAKYGIDLDDPSTLESLSAGDRSMFFLDFYDGLMGFSGVDHVDHWMPTINWRPALTQDLGGGADAKIGLLDATINYDADLLDNITVTNGYTVEGNFHGAAVASLLVSAHDGQGAMGIAPDAEVFLYNPFDDTGTTNWQDVKAGIERLHMYDVNVLNMSLGQPGWTFSDGWVDVLGDVNLNKLLSDVLLVKAAGNDGITQTTDIRWSLNDSLLDQLIIVGSVGPTEHISWFSNRPGEACVIDKFWCSESDKLKYKFVVAPGELILVSDDEGGITRVSGTSFSAPLVAGTATLIMDRWPWLKRNPELVADIIFNTAKDLGEPGVDGTYGWGLLDVEAALSPYAFDNLKIYYGWDKIKTRDLRSAILTPGVLDIWEDWGIVLSSFENYENAHRDFLIPLSTRVFGEEYGHPWDRERTQSYLYQRLIDWAHNGSGFADQRSFTAPLTSNGNWQLSMTARPRSIAEERRTGEVGFHSDLMLASANGALKMRFGTGEATPLFASSQAFGFASDIDPMSGGVNPVFGFASGSGYAGTALSLTENATFSLSFAQRLNDREFEDRYTGQLLPDESGLSPYEAQAASIGFSYQLHDRVSMNVSYTALDETDGLLGAQGGGALSLNGKAETSSTTMGLDVALPRNVMLGVSATRAETEETEFEDSILSLTNGGASSSAYEIALLKTGVAGSADQLRFTFAQPLHVEDGALELNSFAVIDRQTGELGETTQYVPLGGDRRPYVAEMLYAAPVMDGLGNIGTFTRAETNTRSTNAGMIEYSVGTNFRLSF